MAEGSSNAGPELPQEAPQSPLGHLAGARPPAPAWFDWALAQEPERSFVEVEGADIEVLAWGRRGDPGLLLFHGFAAHADWWSFIAPFLAKERRVVALSWSGMGLSGRRDRYTIEQHAREAIAAAEAGGVFDGPAKPVVAGHSYGSFVALWLAANLGHRWAGAVSVDGPLTPVRGDRPSRPTSGVARVYPTMQAALARFRFTPVQTCENLYVVDHIARYSLKPATDADGKPGFSWRFDPSLLSKMESRDRSSLLNAPQCPVAIVMGSRSRLWTPDRYAYTRELAVGMPWVEIPDAGHHIMADQPLALVAGLQGLLAAWPPEAAKRGTRP